MKIAAEIPTHRLAPENIKPTRPITKQTGAEGHQRRIFLALSRRPTAYCRATTTAALTGSTTATFSAKSLLATTSTYCERQEAKAPPTKEASSPEQVNHSSARSRSNTEGDPGRGARAGRGGVIPLKKQLNKHQRKGGGASQNGKLILCITSRLPMGGPTVQPMLRMVWFSEKMRFFSAVSRSANRAQDLVEKDQ